MSSKASKSFVVIDAEPLKAGSKLTPEEREKLKDRKDRIAKGHGVDRELGGRGRGGRGGSPRRGSGQGGGGANNNGGGGGTNNNGNGGGTNTTTPPDTPTVRGPGGGPRVVPGTPPGEVGPPRGPRRKPYPRRRKFRPDFEPKNPLKPDLTNPPIRFPYKPLPGPEMSPTPTPVIPGGQPRFPFTPRGGGRPVRPGPDYRDPRCDPCPPCEENQQSAVPGPTIPRGGGPRVTPTRPGGRRPPGGGWGTPGTRVPENSEPLEGPTKIPKRPQKPGRPVIVVNVPEQPVTVNVPPTEFPPASTCDPVTGEIVLTSEDINVSVDINMAEPPEGMVVYEYLSDLYNNEDIGTHSVVVCVLDDLVLDEGGEVVSAMYTSDPFAATRSYSTPTSYRMGDGSRYLRGDFACEWRLVSESLLSDRTTLDPNLPAGHIKIARLKYNLMGLKGIGTRFATYDESTGEDFGSFTSVDVVTTFTGEDTIYAPVEVVDPPYVGGFHRRLNGNQRDAFGLDDPYNDPTEVAYGAGSSENPSVIYSSTEDNALYQKFGGLPSGTSIEGTLNDMLNSLSNYNYQSLQTEMQIPNVINQKGISIDALKTEFDGVQTRDFYHNYVQSSGFMGSMGFGAYDPGTDASEFYGEFGGGGSMEGFEGDTGGMEGFGGSSGMGGYDPGL